MSPANTSCISTRLWKEADRARQRLMSRPPGGRRKAPRPVAPRPSPPRARPPGRTAPAAGRPAAPASSLATWRTRRKDCAISSTRTSSRAIASPPVAADDRAGSRFVGVVGPGLPGVIGRPRGPADRAQRAVLAGPPGPQRPGAAQPVQERCGAHQQPQVRRDLPVQAGHRREQVGRRDQRRPRTPRREPRRRGRTGCRTARSTSRSTRSLCQPNRAVATASPAASVSRTATSRWQASRSSSACTVRISAASRGHRGAGDLLQRVAVGQRVRDRSDPLDPLGQQHPVAGRQALEPLLDAAVLVEDPHVQVRYLLARRLDQVLDRLHHPGPDRPVRDGEQSGPGHVAGQHALGRSGGLPGEPSGQVSGSRG